MVASTSRRRIRPAFLGDPARCGTPASLGRRWGTGSTDAATKHTTREAARVARATHHRFDREDSIVTPCDAAPVLPRIRDVAAVKLDVATRPPLECAPCS